MAQKWEPIILLLGTNPSDTHLTVFKGAWWLALHWKCNIWMCNAAIIFILVCNCGLRTEDSHLPYTIWGLKNRHQLLDSWPQVVPAWAPLRWPGESKISMRWSWPEEPSDILTYYSYWLFDILVLAQSKVPVLVSLRTVKSWNCLAKADPHL